MEADALVSFLIDQRFPLVLGAVALVVAVLAVIRLSALDKRQAQDAEALRQRLDTLWHDMDEWRVSGFSNPPQTAHALARETVDDARFATERAAYEEIWPQVWALHDKLGVFLRAVEAGEPAGDSRLAARHAALEARDIQNRLKPFCHQEVDELITRLIDADIKAHLAACQYLDLLRDTATSEHSHERNVQRDKFRMIYDGEARELVTRLVEAIRARTLGGN